MKKHAYITISLSLCIILVSYVNCQKTPSKTERKEAKPEVVFKEKQVYIGSVYAELAPFHGSFHFSNLTNNIIELDAKTCCGSRITFRDNKKIYGPGENGEIIFEVSGVSMSYQGLLKKTATIFKKDDNKPVAVLALTANIKRKWHVFPTELNFGKLKPRQTLTAKLEIESGTEEQLRVLGLSEPLPAFLKVDQIAEIDLNGRMHYEYVVSLTGDGKERLIDENISFETNSSTMPNITIPISAEMVGPVIIKPQSLYFGRVSPGTNVSKSLHIISTCEEVLTIQSISSTPNKVQLLKVSPSKDNCIDVALLFSSPSETSGIVRGMLSIIINRTIKDSDEAIELRVPWIASIGSN